MPFSDMRISTLEACRSFNLLLQTRSSFSRSKIPSF